METLLVVGAAILDKGKALVLKRSASDDPHAGLWEFPGGKVQDGENLMQALEREIREELGVEGQAGPLIGGCDTYVADKHIRLMVLRFTLQREPNPADLKAHSEMKWVEIEKLSELAMPPPDWGVLPQITGSDAIHEAEYVDPWSVAKLYGMVNAMIGICFAFAFMWFPLRALPGFGALIARSVLLAIPFGYLLLGLIMGYLMACVYNLFARYFGGVRIRFRRGLL